MEGTETSREFFHGHLCLGGIEHLKLAVLVTGEASLELVELVVGLGHASHVLHGLSG